MILDKRHSAGFDQQVHVVAHKDIGIHLETVPLPVLLQPLQVILPIPITAKNRLPLIAPTDHMIKRPGKFHSRFSCHSATLSIHQLLMVGSRTGAVFRR
jgi:hypothetical protein